jgi:hypothetical protein
MWYYSRATQIDPWPGEYPPTDTGSSGLAVAKAALERRDIIRYEHGFGQPHLDEILQYSPAMVGTIWLDNQFEMDSKGFVDVSGSVAGAHEYVVFGVNFRDDFYWCKNHWRPWGLPHSVFKVPRPKMKYLLDADGDVTVPIAKAT